MLRVLPGARAWGALGALAGRLGKKGNRERAALDFVSTARTRDALVESTLMSKKDGDLRITGGMGRKDAKGEAEVCAKQLGAGESMAQSASCSRSRARPPAHQIVPACAPVRCAEGRAPGHVSRDGRMEEA